MHSEMKKYLNATPIIDSDAKVIIDYARSIVENIADDPIARAVSLYYAVRDGIWYQPHE